ncbi:MAG: hypothetical protein JNK64_01810 [Myxococcales bacterium]|nr:hypothetical protein [Myxococcales bacterium]
MSSRKPRAPATKAPAKPARPAKPAARPFTLFADYHQIHVCDVRGAGDLGEAWTAQAVEDRVAVGAGVVGIGTADAADVRVTVEVLAAAPRDDGAAWDHVTAASLEVTGDAVAVYGCTDYVPEARRFAVASGTWRLRASHRGLAKGPERIRVQLWPAAAAAPRVERRWAPPAAAPAKGAAPTARPRTLAQATAAAWRGEPEVAREVLVALAAAGDHAAAAAAAELFAFAGAWREVVPLATALVGHPDAVRTGNVFTDQCRLLRRAARELDDPGVITRAAAVVPAAMAARRDACLRRDLDVDARDADPAAAAAFAAAVATATSGKRFAGKPAELARHCFALAAAYRLDGELIARWEPGLPALGFDQAVDVARAHARRGDGEAAWAVIAPRLGQWHPLDVAQVAPVILLVDRWLGPIMTPARCAHVLATPRGGAR